MEVRNPSEPAPIGRGFFSFSQIDACVLVRGDYNFSEIDLQPLTLKSTTKMQPNANPGAFFGLAMGMICLILGTFIVVGLIVLVFYLLTLQKALSRVSPRNRLMEPGMVWLMLIPCVNFVWQFMIAINVPGSLRNEFRDRRRDDGSDYGKTLALTAAILGLVSGAFSNGLSRIPNLGLVASGISGLMSLVSLVCFIMFWVKIAGYSAQLDADDRDDTDRRLDKFDDDDDDDDDRDKPTWSPRKRADKDDDDDDDRDKPTWSPRKKRSDGDFKRSDPGEYK